MITSEEIAERMKREILDDVSQEIVPATIADYSGLHDYVDANCYGGTEKLLDEMHDAAPDTEEGHTNAWNSFCGIANPAMDTVDKWIKAGGIHAGPAKRAEQ